MTGKAVTIAALAAVALTVAVSGSIWLIIHAAASATP